jgi:Leucine-rich repeat (LRR) protein
MDDSDESQRIIPDYNHKLDLTNRAWINLDPLIWSFHASLVILDISYNNIVELPPQIGEMTMLKELHVSFNKLKTLPSSIGR